MPLGAGHRGVLRKMLCMGPRLCPGLAKVGGQRGGGSAPWVPRKSARKVRTSSRGLSRKEGAGYRGETEERPGKKGGRRERHSWHQRFHGSLGHGVAVRPLP